MQQKRISSQLYYVAFLGFATMEILGFGLLLILFDIFINNSLQINIFSIFSLVITCIFFIIHGYLGLSSLYNHAYYVEDQGSYLKIKKRQINARVSIENIKDIVKCDHDLGSIILEFKEITPFGFFVKFLPEMTSFKKDNTIYDDLKMRIKA